jgi:hypothetical protein
MFFPVKKRKQPVVSQTTGRLLHTIFKKHTGGTTARCLQQLIAPPPKPSIF